MARDINPAALHPGAYFDMAASAGPAFATGQQQGMHNALLMDEVARDVATRNALADYLQSPEEQRGAAMNALVSQSPEMAAQVLGVEAAQNELAMMQRRDQAAQEYARAQHVLTSESPALALRLLDEDGTFTQQLIDAGLVDPEDGISDDEARLIAQWAADTLAPIAGIGEERTDTLARKLGTVEGYLGRRLEDDEVLKMAGGAGGTTINIGEKLNEPIPVSSIANVRTPDGRPVPIGTTFAEAREMGAEVYSTSEQQRQQQADAAMGILEELETLALGEDGGVFSGVESGVINRVGAALEHGLNMLTQDDPRASRYHDLVNASLSPFIKFLGESGALAEGDVQRALGLMPRIWPFPDTEEVAGQKLRQVREILERGVRNRNLIQAGDMEPIASDSGDNSAPRSAQEMSDEELLRGLGLWQ